MLNSQYSGTQRKFYTNDFSPHSSQLESQQRMKARVGIQKWPSKGHYTKMAVAEAADGKHEKTLLLCIVSVRYSAQQREKELMWFI